ncbi:hypothetical protein AJ78_03078 [Emergomyces pasteurianus Ep9510]|uniref:Uncharacterized protein n=1 Tax=Emergomyces pasteurianus Ep9510 TaxID=1447872 RepID=A0A1J9QLM3_9EURO|nr:hypothetical protein AJ78_03078 [Emergomyces pasteurianus Ep9510]
MTNPADPLPLEQNSLYVLLFDRGEAYRFHWALFLTATHPTTPTTTTAEGVGEEEEQEQTAESNPPGTLFEVTNPNPSNDNLWTYNATILTALTNKHNPLCALKISTIEPLLHEPFQALLGTIPIIPYSQRFGEKITCRVWLKEALYELDQGGFIQLLWPVEEIEKEARALGMLCWCAGVGRGEGRGNGRGRVESSAGCLF